MKITTKKQLLEKTIVFVLSLFYFIPNLLNPHFGLLDDPVIINKSGNISSFIFSALGARLTIFGHFYYALVNMFGVGKPIVSSFIVLLVLYAICLLVFSCIKEVTKKPLLGYLGIILYLLSPGTVENTFTLFKVELFLQLLLATIAYLLLTYKPDSSRTRSVLLYSLTFITYFTKETAVILLPLSFMLFLLDSIQKNKNVKYFRFYFLFNLAVFSVQFLVLKLFVSFSPGTYASMYLVKPRRLILTFIQYMEMLSPFMLYALLIYIRWSIEVITEYIENKKLVLRYNEFLFALTSLLYFIILLPWVWPSPYYVNPAMLFLVIFSAVVLDRYTKEGRKSLLYFLAIFFVFNLAFSINNYFNEGRIRKNTDKIDNELIEFAKNSKKNSKFLLGINQSSEYVYEIDQFDQFNKRSDIAVNGYNKDNETEVLNKEILLKYDYLVLNYSNNVYFNRIVWNTGLTLKDTIKKKCPKVIPIADFQYNIKGLMFGPEDNLPFYRINLHPRMKSIEKEWLIYKTSNLSTCL